MIVIMVLFAFFVFTLLFVFFFTMMFPLVIVPVVVGSMALPNTVAVIVVVPVGDCG